MRHTMTLANFGRMILFLLFLSFAQPAAAQTYTTIADGNWSSSATWLGGSIPDTSSEIPASAVINIHHTVNYNTGDPLKNRGEIRLQPMIGTVAQLRVPTGINVENLSTGIVYVLQASFVQCRFTTCNNGEPYAGNNPGAPLQSGTFKNIGGYMEVANSFVEIAQDWTNEAGGDRVITGSCVRTGQNFSLSGSGSTDSVTQSQISVGWHGSGSVSYADGVAVFDQLRVQLAGTSGNFQLASGTVNGDIDIIQLRNQVVPFVGSGEISASSSVVTSGINLDEYCVSAPTKYVPNGKFVGPQVSGSCSNGGALCFTPSAATASIQGRVSTSDGRGLRNAVIEVVGGEMQTPVRVITNGFGYYQIEELEVGHTYLVSVKAKGYLFAEPTIVVTLEESIADLDFVANPPVTEFRFRGKR